MQINSILNKKIILSILFLSIISINAKGVQEGFDDSLKEKKNFTVNFGYILGSNFSKATIKMDDKFQDPIVSTWWRNYSIAILNYSNLKSRHGISLVHELGLNNISYDLSIYKSKTNIINSSFDLKNIYIQSGIKFSKKKFYVNPSLQIAYAYKTVIRYSSIDFVGTNIVNYGYFNSINMKSKFQIIPQISLGLQTKSLWIDYRFYRTVNSPLVSIVKNYNYYGMGIRLIVFPLLFKDK